MSGLENYVFENIINKIIKTDSYGNKYIIVDDLKQFNLNKNETALVIGVLDAHHIKKYETTVKDRSTLVRDYNYGVSETFKIHDIEQPKMSDLDYANGDLIYENFDDLDEYLEKEFILENVHMVKVKSKNGEPYPSIQLNKLVALKLNDIEMKHALEFLKEREIVVRGKSQDLEDFENYDYVTNYHTKFLPQSMSWDEMSNLFVEFQNTKNPVIREKLILGNLRLVSYVAFKVNRFTNYPREELESIGYEGLINAVDKFDVSMGYKFSTYAFECIKEAMLDNKIMDRTMYIPINLWGKVRSAIQLVEQEYGEEFSSKNQDMFNDVIEILDATGIFKSEKTKKAIIRCIQDNYVYDVESIISNTNVENEAIFSEMQNAINDVLETLTEREAKVLRERYGLIDGRSKTLEEVGKNFHLSRDRIRQIEAKALRKLRNPSRSKKFREYLELFAEYDFSNANDKSDLTFEYESSEENPKKAM